MEKKTSAGRGELKIMWVKGSTPAPLPPLVVEHQTPCMGGETFIKMKTSQE